MAVGARPTSEDLVPKGEADMTPASSQITRKTMTATETVPYGGRYHNSSVCEINAHTKDFADQSGPDVSKWLKPCSTFVHGGRH